MDHDKVNILIVKDEWVTAQTIKTNLEKLEYTVSAIVSTAEEAVHNIIEFQPDCVLIDINLFRKKNGIESAQKIYKTCKIPIVFLTADFDEKTLQEQLTAISPIQDATSGVIGDSNVARDSTQRQPTERLLRQQQFLLSNLIEGTTDLIAALDLNCRYIAFNSAYKAEFLKIFGREIEIGTSMIEALVHLPDEQIKAMEIWGRALAGEEFTVIQEFGDIARHRKCYEITYSSIRDEQGRQIGASHIVKDVSDRIRNEQALRDSEERFRNAFDYAAIGMGLVDLNGHFLKVNRSYCEITGYSEEELLAKKFQEITYPDDLETDLRYVDQLLAGEIRCYHMEKRYIHKQGHIVWVLLSGSLVRDQRGQPLYFIAQVQDITVRKQAEDEREELLGQIEKERSRLEAVLRQMPAAIWIMEAPSGKLVLENDKVESVLGHPSPSSERLEDLSRFFAIHPDGTPYAPEEYPIARSLLTGEVVINEEMHYIKGDGSQAILAIYSSPIRDAQREIIAAIGAAFDITERKQTELEIQRSKDLKEAIFNDSADAIFLVDCETLLTFDCNYRAVQLFEAHSKDDLIGIAGHTLQCQQFTPQELVAIAQDINTTGVWSREVEYFTKQGKRFWGNLAVKQINVASRTINLVRVTDITVQKQSQEQIKASLKEKEVLLKEIHHRVKNNLQIVKSLLQMQARRTQEREAFLVLQDSQNRITSIALVHEKLYRSDDLANIDFAHYIPDLTAHLFDTYNVSSATVTLNIEVDSIVLDINAAIPCGLIINELVSNSIKYAFPNRQQGEVNVKFQDNKNGTMTLIVQDNGIGIPEEFNIETTQSLGLTLVQGLVEQLEGSIELDRSRGTSFRITLPRS